MQIELTIEEIKENIENKTKELQTMVRDLIHKDSIESLITSGEIQRKCERLSEFIEHLHKRGGFINKTKLQKNL